MLPFEASDSDGLRGALSGVLPSFELAVFDLDDSDAVLFSESFSSVFIVISSREFDFPVLSFEYGEVEVRLGDLERERVAGMLQNLTRNRASTV